jgi:hypothetical protein
MIVQCATKIETMGHDIMSSLEDPDDFEADFSNSKNEIPFEIWSSAESVVGVMFANFATLYDNSFCEKWEKSHLCLLKKVFQVLVEREVVEGYLLHIMKLSCQETGR